MCTLLGGGGRGKGGRPYARTNSNIENKRYDCKYGDETNKLNLKEPPVEMRPVSADMVEYFCSGAESIELPKHIQNTDTSP